jgi:hypothetical protein
MFYCEPCGTERAWPVDGLTMAMTGTQPPGTSEVTDGR